MCLSACLSLCYDSGGFCNVQSKLQTLSGSHMPDIWITRYSLGSHSCNFVNKFRVRSLKYVLSYKILRELNVPLYLWCNTQTGSVYS